jgi:hypothetical protein
VTPPVVARLLVVAVAPPRDYESIAGDLHEEYVQRVDAGGRVAADRWYWSQTIRSIPSLLSYSRVRGSFMTIVATVVVFLVFMLAMVLCASLVLGEFLQYAYSRWGGSALAWSWAGVFGAWIVAAMFGGILSAILRGHGHRLTIAAAIVLALAFIVPPLLGQSAPLDPWQWLLLLGAVPAIGVGATTFQLIRRR